MATMTASPGSECHRLPGDAGDERANWDGLLENARRTTLTLARSRYHLCREDAEDVAQIVQLRVAERLRQLRSPEAFPAWLRRMIHRAVADHLRCRRRVEISLDQLGPEPVVQPLAGNEQDPYEAILLREALEMALRRLPALYREPIRMNILDGMPQEEIGRRLGRTRSAVASQIERGLARLQRQVPVGIL